jgi:hypothetical protein
MLFFRGARPRREFNAQQLVSLAFKLRPLGWLCARRPTPRRLLTSSLVAVFATRCAISRDHEGGSSQQLRDEDQTIREVSHDARTILDLAETSCA